MSLRLTDPVELDIEAFKMVQPTSSWESLYGKTVSLESMLAERAHVKARHRQNLGVLGTSLPVFTKVLDAIHTTHLMSRTSTVYLLEASYEPKILHTSSSHGHIMHTVKFRPLVLASIHCLAWKIHGPA